MKYKLPISEFVRWTSEYLHMSLDTVTRVVDKYMGNRKTLYLNQSDMYILRDLFLKHMDVNVVSTENMTYYIRYIDKCMSSTYSRVACKYYDGIKYATGIL